MRTHPSSVLGYTQTSRGTNIRKIGRVLVAALPLVYTFGGLIAGGAIGYRNVGITSAEEVLQRRVYHSIDGTGPLKRLVDTKKALTNIAELSSDGLISEEDFFGRLGATERNTHPFDSKFSYFTPRYSSMGERSSSFTEEEDTYTTGLRKVIKQCREVTLEQRKTYDQLVKDFGSLTDSAKKGPISQAEREKLETIVAEMRTYSDNGIGIKSESELGRTMLVAIDNYQVYLGRIENDGTIYSIASDAAWSENVSNKVLGALVGSLAGMAIGMLPFFWSPPKRREEYRELDENNSGRAQSP